ncbi:putative mRNA cleavage and polyadenylation specificity factor complex subunit pta1 [Glarea lozoyensis 74030]|uniref:Putative mRNA cleavage and polyadenylation specificity factor complex subunit pta1 n=1 Tax=Glarea lozoyensis (strain ATCC 74030 / MF5533) TaxID=1104152 RepID=H0EGA2_GLAL7|nr:putative mRNA cleavage and polyadenylation specificity factor complex subunit pta1 [Glarea lozoyensis 74030]
MAAPMSVDQQIKLLEEARRVVLNDPNYYQQIIQGILPLIDPRGKGEPQRDTASKVELQRWGAEFLAETFASPAIPPQQKETLCLTVLEALRSMLDDPNQDNAVVKSVVQTAASIYPLVFRWIINNSYDNQSWERIQAIKTRILQIWDTAAPGRGDPMEVSLGMVPPNHSSLIPRNLEAEASGLLDRMLGIFQESISRCYS